MNPKLLSPEELDVQFYAHQWGNMAQSHAAQLALRAHIAALEADNAALLDTLRGVMGHVRISSADMGGNHRYSITNDYGCSADMGRGRIVADADNHPGATLLSEHAKALEAAHADGRRHALLQALDRLGMDSASMYRDPEATDVRLSDELWEHVRWLEVRARNEGLEMAAKRADACADESAGWTARAPRRVASWVADTIRAMKETEE